METFGRKGTEGAMRETEVWKLEGEKKWRER
jgi:hypothetical protein